MATNKERIENLEVGMGGLQDGMRRVELGVADKLHQLLETINRMTETMMFSNKEGSNYNNPEGNSRTNKVEPKGSR